ncbi:MAG: hypothetical protein QMC81_08090 [Thermoanaerobacterales bacterium]|nr:hypothetical protein [Thermoanaerobacterales bacterium]
MRVFSGQEIPQDLVDVLRCTPRRLHIDDWCLGCGSCVAACHAHALVPNGEQPDVDPGLCCLCGYCAAACPDFCIKVI